VSAPTLPAEVWQAARIAAGEKVPEATRAAWTLARRAMRAADRGVMEDIVSDLDVRHAPTGKSGPSARYVPSGRSGPRVSDVGGCGRAVWYREHPPTGYVPAKVDRRQAALGTVIHQAGERARAYRYPWRRYEFEVRIPGLDKRGKIDEYDPVLGEVSDLKTESHGKWGMTGEDGPSDSAWAQVMVYALAVEEMGWPVRTVRIMAVNRSSGEEEHFRRDYDPAEARDALDELVGLATLLDLGVVPARIHDAGPDAFPCGWCPARLHCWNVEAAKAAGRSPQSYTVLGPEPDDPTIEWAARRVHAATKAATEAEKAKEAVTPLLEGIPPGTYGRMQITARSRKMPDHKAHANRVLGLYPLPKEHRPPVEQIEHPPRRTDRWMEAKPVRAAKRQPKERNPR
jgi:hypothetical protein